MGGIRNYIFRSVKGPPYVNTFVGGMGAIWSTPALFVANFSILVEADIENFSVDADNNISCFIVKSYNTVSGAFAFHSDFTYYIDADGFMATSQGNAFRGNPKLRRVHLPGTTGIIGSSGGGSSWNTNGFNKYLALPSVATIYNTAFTDHTALKWLIMDALTYIYMQTANRTSLWNLNSLERFYMPYCDTIDWKYTFAITSFSNIKTGCIIYCHPDLETNAPAHAWVTMGGGSFGDTVTINGLVYTLVATKTDNTEFETGNNAIQMGQNLSASINADTRTGTLGDVTSASNNATVGLWSDVVGAGGDATTLASSFWTISGATFSGGGGRNGAIEYIEDTRGGDIRYVDDFTLPSPPTALASSNITDKSVDLTFTPPTPNVNGTDGYQVWINDGITPWHPYEPFDEVIASGNTLWGLRTGRTYQIKLRTFDGFYNLSLFTTEITVAVPAVTPASSLPLVDITSRYIFNDNVDDVVGTNDGTPANLTYETGTVLKRGVFNGTTSEVEVADSADLSFIGVPFSVSLLASFADTSDGWIINKREASNHEWQLYYYQGYLGVALMDSGAVNLITLTEAFIPTIDKVYHLTFTHDGSNLASGLRFYIDGVSVGIPDTIGTFTGMTNGTAKVKMGVAGWFSGFFHNGTLEEAIVWDTELTDSEVLFLSNEQLAGVDI